MPVTDNGNIRGLIRNESNETINANTSQKSRPSDESMEMDNNNSNETRYRLLHARGEEKARELNSSIAAYDQMDANTFTLSSQLHNQGTIQYSPNSKHTRYDLGATAKRTRDYHDYINPKDCQIKKMVTSHSTIGSFA